MKAYTQDGSVGIESGITEAFARSDFPEYPFALGYFVLKVAGESYGVREPDATMMGNIYDDVRDRVKNQGRHVFPLLAGTELDAVAIAFRMAWYGNPPSDQRFFGMPADEFVKEMFSRQIPFGGGDEEFDDGSTVLQLDESDHVRLVAFKAAGSPGEVAAGTIRAACLPAAEFYSLFSRWADAFRAQWNAMPKTRLSIER